MRSRISRERYLSRLPAERIREQAVRRVKSQDICRYVVGLDNESHVVVVVWTAPSADLESDFAAVLLRTGAIPSVEGQDGSTLQPRDIAYNECIGSISEVASRLDFRATPLVVIL